MNILSCRGLELPIGDRTIVMGILNVTPDSFSDGGNYISIEAAIQRARQMVAEGADIIDIGGESTRPGSAPVGEEEELRRVIPVIQALSKEINVPLSIDTYKAEVAKQAIEAGAHIINDVWGGMADKRMAQIAAQFDCPFVITHNRTKIDYDDFLQDVLVDLQACIDLALQAGVNKTNIILDPGIGFAKTYEQNLFLMKRLRDVSNLGYPVLLGVSRKSMIRTALGGLPPDDCLEGTASAVTLGIAQGCGIIRVHDIEAMKRVAVMTDAVIRA